MNLKLSLFNGDAIGDRTVTKRRVPHSVNAVHIESQEKNKEKIIRSLSFNSLSGPIDCLWGCSATLHTHTNISKVRKLKLKTKLNYFLKPNK